MLALAALLARPALAQSTTTTFHVYVDPVYGDDAQAAALNPSPMTSTGGRPFQAHPGFSAGIPGFLQHAPYSFRTVTGMLAWFNSQWPATMQGLRLPWVNTTTEQTVEYIVVHCLPGLYGPALPTAIDAESGLAWNGEMFPLNIPQRVGIQGTSAIDTIFDARREDTSIFYIGWPNPDHGHAFGFTFIDSVTIRGARGGGTGSPGGGRPGAGVLIDNEHPVGATISNCIFTDNSCGIGVWQDDPGYLHNPIIVNNTFAWNEVGIWNGSIVTTPSQGNNLLRVLNNVFDSSPPTGLPPGHVFGMSGFEGVDVADRTVTVINTTPANIDFNAFEWPTTLRRVNIGDTGAAPYAWPRTTTRNTNQSYIPVVPIQAYTQPPTVSYGSFSTNRQVLYINDVFRKDPALPAISRHDFRLAPTARLLSGNEQPIFNPLINRGADFGFDALGNTLHTGLIAWGNGLNILYSPGLPAGAEAVATVNCWDWDTDGFGNRRVAHRKYAPTTPYGHVDLGADESLELTISGYVTSTRTFSRPHPAVASNTAGIGSRDSLYLFNVNGQQNNVYARPQFNFNADIVYTTPHQRPTATEWYNQAVAATHPYNGGGTNYTNGQFDNRTVSTATPRNYRWERWAATLNPSPRFMRNLACDIAPHLLHDVRPDLTNLNLWWPWWGERLRFATTGGYYPYPLYEDIFKCNPWYNAPTPPSAVLDNAFLYFDPVDPNKWVRDAHINPPLAVKRNMVLTTTKRHLFTNNLHPILLWEWGSTTFAYTINSYGRITIPDPVPYVSPWHGVRVNLELLDPDNSYWTTTGVPDNNVQTFLAIVDEDNGTPQLFTDGAQESKSAGVQDLIRDTSRKRSMLRFLEKRRSNR